MHETSGSIPVVHDRVKDGEKKESGEEEEWREEERRGKKKKRKKKQRVLFVKWADVNPRGL